MMKRVTTLTISLFLLLVPVTETASRTAFATDNPPPRKERVEDRVVRAIEEARKRATYTAAAAVAVAVAAAVKACGAELARDEGPVN